MPETPVTEAEIFKIPETRFYELESRVEKFSRRAAKLSQSPITIEVVGEETEEAETDYGYKYVRVFKLVKVNGKAPVVAGYTFVARLEHTEAGNIMSRAPSCEGIEIPSEVRESVGVCNHCSTNRRRKDTFIIRNDETGALKLIGRNCLADYLRDESAALALNIWKLLEEVRFASREDDDFGYGSDGCGYGYPSTSRFIAHVFRAIEVYGWVSRKAAYEDGSQSTSARAEWSMDQRNRQSRGMAEIWDKAQPTDDNVEDAAKAIEYAKAMKGDNDYEQNLKVACSLDYVKPKNQGLVASVAFSYKRHVERELERAREAERTANRPASAHFGTVGSRYVRKLAVLKTHEMENEYGVTVLYTMEDDTGNVFKWWASNGGCMVKTTKDEVSRSMKTGDEFYFTFQVKSHGEYREVEETTITRATPNEEPPTHKWVNTETGEVFKTKKAMKAAMEAA